MAGLKFRVFLDSIKGQEIFRDISIGDNFNFEHFYNAILDSFDLPNNELASFYLSNKDWGKGEEISLLDMTFDDFDDSDAPDIMSNIQLKEKIFSHSQRFILIHDFLSMWIFLIELTEITDEVIDAPKLLIKVGEIPEDIKKSGPNKAEDLNFNTEFDATNSDFDEHNSGFDSDDFENIDDLDI